MHCSGHPVPCRSPSLCYHSQLTQEAPTTKMQEDKRKQALMCLFLPTMDYTHCYRGLERWLPLQVRAKAGDMQALWGSRDNADTVSKGSDACLWQREMASLTVEANLRLVGYRDSVATFNILSQRALYPPGATWERWLHRKPSSGCTETMWPHL